MKIGIIGLGNIAQKAYLPSYAALRNKVTFVLASRNETVRKEIAEKYGFETGVETIEELIQEGIEACFVHVATKVHAITVEKLINAGIHVFIDKPLSENPAEVKALQHLAHDRKLLLMIGFNRRFAPRVEELKQVEKKNVLILQKNRVMSQNSVPFAIYDLFLHVVDTAVYLLDDDIFDSQSKIIEEKGFLKRALLQLETKSTTVICSMNLFSGANTETFQVMSEEATYVLENLTDLTIKTGRGTEIKTFDDWTGTLEKRGFQQMVTKFIHAVETGNQQLLRQEKTLLSHELCGKMLLQHERHIL
ncbi:Gfo/Idh/MocA family protein [Enterococcus rivorum]|uniref:Oxidoreductase n=1 Tax=Enterococcus rivorum TaxID=762845 RepID=A0A1E5L191_9ENTE|nr:Gfo/Idh/MocA family oxidoreductase [Enterococcus rivorum]MBP2098575.1 virulence factor [Enterococcus rivorum]OEH83853.1 oxidoreductase [Enterococcus rivorum]